jgi:uncharacterized membrane protein YqjE
MGFEPQTAGQPLVNVNKRTTQVNFAIVISIILFLVVGIAGAVWAVRKTARGEPVLATPPPAK